jgi:hypothetical protein
MNSKLIELYATLVATLTARDEKGQGTLEYVGIVVVAGILVAAVVDALGNGGEITKAIKDEITEIINAGAN